LGESHQEIIKYLLISLGIKDPYTLNHCLKVSKYACIIGKHIGLSEEKCDELKLAGILHDIGKIGISVDILQKPSKLTREEYGVIKEHPVIGYKMLKNFDFSNTMIYAIKYHHKRYDLRGYPYKICADSLPIEVSIIGVADAFDAMTTNRVYKKAMTLERALDELINNKGTQFHPEIVDAMADIHNRVKIANFFQGAFEDQKRFK